MLRLALPEPAAGPLPAAGGRPRAYPTRHSESLRATHTSRMGHSKWPVFNGQNSRTDLACSNLAAIRGTPRLGLPNPWS